MARKFPTMMRGLILAAGLAAGPAMAAAPLPKPVRAMIATALGGGDPVQIKAVVEVARAAYPASTAEIEAMVDAARPALERAERARRAAEAAQTAAAWKGEVELGAARATGNSDTLGLFGAAQLRQEGEHWRHRITARADVQETNGIRSTERFLGSWQPAYKFDPSYYAYGLAQYEHDRFLGYTDRVTFGAGLGLVIASEPGLSLELDGGPTVRVTRFVGGDRETAFAGRAALSAKWQASPTMKLTQTAALYLQDGDTNASMLTAIEAKLIGPFKGRLSYQLLYERDAPPERDPVDTLSRATLVYTF